VVDADEAFDRLSVSSSTVFHSTGSAELTVPRSVHVEVWRGPEYRVARADVNVPTGRRVLQRIVSSASIACRRAAGGAGTCMST